MRNFKAPSPLPLSRKRAMGVLEKSFSSCQFCYHPTLTLPVQGGYFFHSVLCSTLSIPDREGIYSPACHSPFKKFFNSVSLKLLPVLDLLPHWVYVINCSSFTPTFLFYCLPLPVQGGDLFYIYPPLLDYKISLI